MILPFSSRRPETWESMRARMLRETEAFLEHGLMHPGSHMRIPAVRVGTAVFPRGFGDAFWSQVLATS